MQYMSQGPSYVGIYCKTLTSATHTSQLQQNRFYSLDKKTIEGQPEPLQQPGPLQSSKMETSAIIFNDFSSPSHMLAKVLATPLTEKKRKKGSLYTSYERLFYIQFKLYADLVSQKIGPLLSIYKN